MREHMAAASLRLSFVGRPGDAVVAMRPHLPEARLEPETRKAAQRRPVSPRECERGVPLAQANFTRNPFL
jgi:hypothetical protein